MIRIFLDIEGEKPDHENSREEWGGAFRAPAYRTIANPNFDEYEEASESNPKTIQEEVPYVESRPFVDVPDDTDLATKIVDGGVLRDMTAQEIAAIESDNIDALKNSAQAEIDLAATRARDRYRSKNKDATYINKSAELDKWIAAGRPANGAQADYPYLYLEAARVGETLTQRAELIEATRAAWVPSLDPVIESECIGGKSDVSAATSEAEINAVRDAAIAILDNV